MTYGFALAAALCYAVGWVLQQREAALQPERPSLHVSLLWHLARRRLWLMGIGAMVAGNVLQSVSLGLGTLGQVEPLLVASLLFALPIGAAWSRQHLSWKEWVAALAVSGGVAVFIVVGNPHGTAHVGGAYEWTLTGAAAGGGSAIIALIGFRVRSVTAQAALFATAAGVLFGVADAMTKSLFALISDHGIVHAAVSWQPYALVATSIYGLLLSQDAYKDAPLPASLPPILIAEPLVGIVVGVTALGEHLAISSLDLLWETLSIVLMAGGTYWLAHSPLVVAEMRHERAAALAERRKAAQLR